MPIYEYSCPDCGHDFEALQKFSDDPVRDCPKCNAANVKKRISATSFVLKGGGWYKDHYGLKSGSSSSSSDASSTSSSSASSAGASTSASTSASSTTPSAPAAK